jgi:hypothetical protein
MLQGNKKFGMNITGRPKRWYEYYRVIEMFVRILLGDKKVGINITGRSKIWYEYYRVNKRFV